ncbi:MAG: methyltransferase domain-containing protein [Fuerstiella sp.]
MSASIRFFLCSMALATFSVCVAQDTAVVEPPAAVANAPANQDTARPGLNDRFLDPELDVSEWLGRFEIESREVYSARERVLDACGIKPGMSVADIGAGTGFYTRLFAETVGKQGWVYAVDISPRFLEDINNKADEQKVSNLTCVLCSERSAHLPPNSVDVVFICDTYHHFAHHESTLASIHKALKPGGTLVLVEFHRIPGQSTDFIMGHVRAGQEVFKSEIVSAGFEFDAEVSIPTFKENYLLKFRKPQ